MVARLAWRAADAVVHFHDINPSAHVPGRELSNAREMTDGTSNGHVYGHIMQLAKMRPDVASSLPTVPDSHNLKTIQLKR